MLHCFSGLLKAPPEFSLFQEHLWISHLVGTGAFRFDRNKNRVKGGATLPGSSSHSSISWGCRSQTWREYVPGAPPFKNGILKGNFQEMTHMTHSFCCIFQRELSWMYIYIYLYSTCLFGFRKIGESFTSSTQMGFYRGCIIFLKFLAASHL